MKVIVASKNPVKLRATEFGFSSYFENIEVSGISADSGVSDQPMTNDETLKGALNRVLAAREIQADATYWVGIEGGLENNGETLTAFAWIVISDGKRIGKARTTSFELPEKVRNLIEQGLELGSANDVIFKKTNSKQKSGAVGLLTREVINRTVLYQQAVQLALIPFINPELY